MLRRLVATEMTPDLRGADEQAVARMMGHSVRTHREIYRLERESRAEEFALLRYQTANSHTLRPCS